MNKINKIKKILCDKKMLKFGLGLKFGGYLKEIGWVNSYKTYLPQDDKGSPLPWVTYSFISFIEKRLKKDFYLFEYGSGASTEFYSKKIKEIYSVEHDREWYEKLKENLPLNANIFYEELSVNGDYSKKIKQMNKKFDIIIVDGRDRVNCIKNSWEYLEENGVMVLDDSQRESYQEGIEFLTGKGFKNIEFWGIAPGVFYNKCTTIFYREKNVLGI